MRAQRRVIMKHIFVRFGECKVATGKLQGIVYIDDIKIIIILQ